eukprot:TRINITY_DN61008_c0_g1_i2.p1 TRINITY_DN61008_c0_g1~~TRINITY_DN61008_c0_g1_i2.p1  ORF type:complete len:104 (+),score=32.59 TRINITY_DN61008_c0_g1_i2:173-484(+)
MCIRDRCWVGTTVVDGQDVRCIGKSQVTINGVGELVDVSTISCDPVFDESTETEVGFAKSDLLIKVWNKKGVAEVVRLIQQANFKNIVTADAAKANKELLELF